MRKILAGLTFIAGLTLHAQEKEAPKLGWNTSGSFSLLFNQAAFNADWQGGGTSSYAGNIGLTYNFNYRNEEITWDNRITAEYGLSQSKDDDYLRKTNDVIELHSVFGNQIKDSNWFVSVLLNAKSQFTKGYDYIDTPILDPITGEELGTNTKREETTHALSPAYLTLGPGFLWKKSDNLKVNISPASARLIMVDKDFTSTPGYVDGDYYGVDQGKTSRFEFGTAINAYAKFDLMENVSMENILSMYSNYLEDPKNVDMDYTMNLVMKVNKYISANFVFQAIYNDNAVSAFQIREVLGAGLTYNFD